MIKDIVEKTGYIECVEEGKLQNILEFASSAEGVAVKDFMDKISFSSVNDEFPINYSVSLMLLHNAKGLEFPVVFIIGMEEGMLPYFKAIEDPEEMQEERRLFYVGMTRARDVLCLTGVKKRRLYSKVQDQEPSRFLLDIPKDCCQWMEKTFKKPDGRQNVLKVSHKKPVSVYMVGCRVKHPSWGVGVVRDCSGEGDDTKITVNFTTVGLKRLAMRFANLEKI
jgi:DNA helicase-2/ATP-dependent DNA helicase PcrA